MGMSDKTIPGTSIQYFMGQALAGLCAALPQREHGALVRQALEIGAEAEKQYRNRAKTLNPTGDE